MLLILALCAYFQDDLLHLLISRITEKKHGIFEVFGVKENFMSVLFGTAVFGNVS